MSKSKGTKKNGGGSSTSTPKSAEPKAKISSKRSTLFDPDPSTDLDDQQDTLREMESRLEQKLAAVIDYVLKEGQKNATAFHGHKEVIDAISNKLLEVEAAVKKEEVSTAEVVGESIVLLKDIKKQMETAEGRWDIVKNKLNGMQAKDGDLMAVLNRLGTMQGDMDQLKISQTGLASSFSETV